MFAGRPPRPTAPPPPTNFGVLEDKSTQQEHDRLVEQEQQFDKMFERWEENFEQWRSDNEGNPDRDYVENHIREMNKLREKMLQRRETLNRKRHELLGIPILEAAPTATKRKATEEEEGVNEKKSGDEIPGLGDAQPPPPSSDRDKKVKNSFSQCIEFLNML